MVIRKSLLVIAVIVFAMLSGAVGALAAHDFSDVPARNVFHNDISWLADNGVTLGCNPPANDHFCPNDPVTRAQMAAFLHRFANVTVERTIAIDQFGFQPVRDNHDFLDYDYQAAGAIGRISEDILGASVPVPDGATITGFSATFCDSSAPDNYEAMLLRRPDPAVTAYAEVMADVVTSTTDCAVTLSTTSITNPTVDTSNYSYAILVRPAAGSTYVNIRRATVTYEEPLVP